MSQRSKEYKYCGTERAYVPAVGRWVEPGETVHLPAHLTVGDSIWKPVKRAAKRKGKK